MAAEELRRAGLLKKLIETAFADVRHPGDAALLHPSHSDAHGEIVDFRGQPWNKDWKRVPREVIEENYSSLLFLSAQAFRFYLPAYMSRALGVQRDDSASQVLPFTLYSLNPESDDPAFLRHFLSQVEGFTTQQEEAVRSFLEAIRDHQDDEILRREAGQALQRYWEKSSYRRTMWHANLEASGGLGPFDELGQESRDTGADLPLERPERRGALRT